MKTERRHELQTNVLADWLGRQIEAIRPYTNIIIGVAVVLLVVIGVYSIWSAWSRSAAAQAWTEYFDVTLTDHYVRDKHENIRQKALEAYRDQLRKEKNDPNYELTDGEQRLVDEELSDKLDEALRDDVLAMARKYEGTNLGLFANMRAGDMALMSGLDSLFPNAGQPRDFKRASELLDDAIRYYERALQQASDTMLVRRLKFNLARAYESRAAQPGGGQSGDLEKALGYYKELATGSDVFASAAREQVKALEAENNVYSWFASTEASSPAASTPSPLGGSLFEQFHQQPMTPDFGPGLTNPLPSSVED